MPLPRLFLQGAAAIELQDIDPRSAADYLTRSQLDPPPQGWHELISRLRHEPGGPLAQALSNPLMITVVRDTYRSGDDVGDLLGLLDADGRPASSEDIANHLLDQVVPAAYTQQPGEPPPRYDLVTAERALRRLAMRMNQDGTRDLQWWQVPACAHAAPRIIATCLGVGLMIGLAAGLGFGLELPPGIGDGLPAGITLGLAAGIAAALAFGRRNKIPRRIAPIRWRQLFRRGPLVMGLVAGIATGGLSWGLFRFATGFLVWVAIWFGAALAAWLGAGVVTGTSRTGIDNTSPLSPLSSWRSDRAFGLLVGLAAGAAAGLFVAPEPWLGFGLLARLTAGLAFGLAVGLAVGLAYPQSWSSSLAFAQLAASDRTPVRLMRFLEDARSRSVLRTVGPAYQFRHARLQDRLARQGTPAGIPAQEE